MIVESLGANHLRRRKSCCVANITPRPLAEHRTRDRGGKRAAERGLGDGIMTGGRHERGNPAELDVRVLVFSRLDTPPVVVDAGMRELRATLELLVAGLGAKSGTARR